MTVAASALERIHSGLHGDFCEHGDFGILEDEGRRMLVINDDNLVVLLHPHQLAIEHFLEVGPAQIVIVALRLVVGQKRGIENDKARMWQPAFTAKFH